ncbi:MAG TPA: energy transducer TonB, partial [Chitinophagaceae bacterium]|nr:energy transducer TonB [Chitinophagaceae bacterium]
MEANKILSSDLLDLVFEGRNKDYGAYELRKRYNKRITMALIITASVALLALIGSIVASEFKGNSNEKLEIKEVTIQDLKQEEEPKELPPPPPPKPPDPPKIEMKQFTPPKIVKDEEVQEPPPAQEELKEAKIDVVNQEGIKDEGIVAP